MIQEFQDSVQVQLIEVMNMLLHLIQFETIVDLIQMKFMKGLGNMRNMMIQDFEHSVEFHLIYATNMKSQMTRSELIAILIQMIDNKFLCIL
jgi:hypothetical protein